MAEWQIVDQPSVADTLLVCPTCDDVFVPQFYRDCPWCGFRFESGLVPQVPGKPVDLRIAGGIVLGIAAAAGFLWMLSI